jgi:hypothetical protein
VRSTGDYWKYYVNPAAIIELGEHDFWYKRLVYENPLYDYSATVRVVSEALSVLNRKFLSRNAVVRHGRLNPESEAFELTVRLLQAFAGEVRANGSVPVILLLPDADRLGADGRGHVDAYEALVSRLRVMGLPYLDLAAAFDRPVTRARHFMEGGHYSPESNRIVADAIAAYLRARGLLP